MRGEKNQELELENDVGSVIDRRDEQMDVIVAFYQKFYNSLLDESEVVRIPTFRTEAEPLQVRITSDEVAASAAALKMAELVAVAEYVER
jgi:hypothetical protein